MASWDYRAICLGFNKNKNNTKLIQQFAKSMNFYENKYDIIIDGDLSDGYEGPLNGPAWDYSENNEILVYDSDDCDQGQVFFNILNFLFDKVSVYSMYDMGDSISGSRECGEITFDANAFKIIERSQWYSQEAPDTTTKDIDPNNFPVIDKDFKKEVEDLIYYATEEGCTELLALIKEKGLMD